MRTIEIIQKEYLPEQQKLVDIFSQHVQGVMQEFPIVYKMPDKPNKVRSKLIISHVKMLGYY